MTVSVHFTSGNQMMAQFTEMEKTGGRCNLSGKVKSHEGKFLFLLLQTLLKWSSWLIITIAHIKTTYYILNVS